ncbi:MAG: UDP-N-acetylmuramate--L-alanine ligase [Planctomycetota bacterium]|nr:UDP-N-acetylmuramate--L-alanine ligase [Planctomycetota bacterium]
MRFKRIHLVGIGGSGMSALAEHLIEAGVAVSGSDRASSATTDSLRRLGARVFDTHDEKNLPPDADVVVRSAAVPDDNPEVAAARRLGLKVVKYAEMLGELTAANKSVCVSGCHGKTTTSSMLAHVFMRCGLDPGFMIGGVVAGVNRSSRVGRGEYFVAEACEYDRSFHRLRPHVAVITNIDADHLDYYRDIDEIEESFRVFVSLVPAESGLVVVNGEDPRALRAAASSGRKYVKFALSDPADGTADWTAVEPGSDAAGISFRALNRGTDLGLFRSAIYGLHNVKNALATLAVCDFYGLPLESVRAAILDFPGVGRRLEAVGEANGMPVFDDYGHHPTEIGSVISAARSRWPGRKVWFVFQPHQHARTKLMMDAFAEVLHRADMTILVDIYAARDTEADKKTVHSKQLAHRLAERGAGVVYCASFAEAAEYARRNAGPDKVLITLGAGNVWKVGRMVAGMST